MSFRTDSHVALPDEAIDLTSSNLSPHSARVSLSRYPRKSAAFNTSQDHMHKVVELLRPRATVVSESSPFTSIDQTIDTKKFSKHCRKHYAREVQAGGSSQQYSTMVYGNGSEGQGSKTLRSQPHRPPQNSASPLLSPLSLISSPLEQPSLGFFHPENVPEPKKNVFVPFPFMDFPPEIRNNVYRMLLTTGPIELPELTGRNGAAHRARWAKCTTAKMKRLHKTIFLEILICSKQTQEEGSGILYGCNIFKYRSNSGEGARRVVLPTRHLHLLKNIKISIISCGIAIHQTNQDETIADLVMQFRKDGLRLETFELTWFGNARYHLRNDSLVCHALKKLNVRKHFTIKVAGEARMERLMDDELKRVLHSRLVEIHRPVKAISGGELSDSE